ncbi:MAG TPA: cytochrome c [Baekduia sp.]|uniref:c-type cytochrome n=1 Tax=Baekduia sp. TaxID=2600305 RepID=UPI002BAB7814|nr:cytochrome c [Baekduia sp.]HMJ36156.1 cytochrome c [Baekduia sp.]
MPRRFLLPLTALVVAAGAATGCGQEKNDVKQPGVIKGVPAEYEVGAKLFVERCSACHNLGIVGAEGGALKVKGRERVDGPNFNVRKEDRESVLYAIRNGGFSGAIMPQDIVVGKEAEQVADFLAKYAGHGKSKNARN